MDQHTIKTYRYLRVGMVLLVVALGAAVATEVATVAGHCFQTSISAYYYTPAQGVFVGTLIAIGVSMIALKGNTEWEDLFLNIAGMLAPVVALVPTPYPGDRCFSVPVTPEQQSANVTNNMTALFAVAVLGYLVTLGLAARDARRGDWDGKQTVAMAFAALLIAAAIGVFVADRDLFDRNAHYTAAIVMFGFIIAVVGWNWWAVRREPGQGALAAAYGATAALMLGSAVVMFAITKLADWDHGVLFIEATLISLFAVFWLIQTKELWGEGLRHVQPVAPGDE